MEMPQDFCRGFLELFLLNGFKAEKTNFLEFITSEPGYDSQDRGRQWRDPDKHAHDDFIWSVNSTRPESADFWTSRLHE